VGLLLKLLVLSVIAHLIGVRKCLKADIKSTSQLNMRPIKMRKASSQKKGVQSQFNFEENVRNTNILKTRERG